MIEQLKRELPVDRNLSFTSEQLRDSERLDISKREILQRNEKDEFTVQSDETTVAMVEVEDLHLFVFVFDNRLQAPAFTVIKNRSTDILKSLLKKVFNLGPIADRLTELQMVWSRIKFESEDQFTRDFYVFGPDKSAIRDILNPQRRRALGGVPKRRIEVIGNTLVLVFEFQKIEPEHFKDYIEEGLKTLNAMQVLSEELHSQAYDDS